MTVQVNSITKHVEEVRKSTCTDYEKTLIIGNLNTIIGIIKQRIEFLDKLGEEYYKNGDYKSSLRMQQKVEELKMLVD